MQNTHSNGKDSSESQIIRKPKRALEQSKTLFAERTRFELVIPLPVCRFSKPVDSATLPPLQSFECLPQYGFTKWDGKYKYQILFCNRIALLGDGFFLNGAVLLAGPGELLYYVLRLPGGVEQTDPECDRTVFQVTYYIF